jgi:hypothetical protein
MPQEISFAIKAILTMKSAGTHGHPGTCGCGRARRRSRIKPSEQQFKQGLERMEESAD